MEKMKIGILALMMVLLAGNAFATTKISLWGFTLLEYGNDDVITIQPPQPTIQQPQIATQYVNYQNYQPQPISIPKSEFEDEITLLNSFQMVKDTLRDLGYSKIGLLDYYDGNLYTFTILPDGTILKAERGLYDPNIIIEGNSKVIKDDALNGNFEALKNDVKIPMTTKLKLFWLNL